MQWPIIVVYFILCCFMKLGFSDNLNRTTIKILSQSMECCLCIWLFLTRNNKNWTPSAANFKVKDTAKEICKSPSPMSPLKQTTNPVWNAKSIRHVRFINKANTCYANSIFEILRVVPILWHRVPLQLKAFSRTLLAIILNIPVKKNSTKPVYPHSFYEPSTFNGF